MARHLSEQAQMKALDRKVASFTKKNAKKALRSSGSTGSKSKRRSKADREVDDMATGLVALAVVGAAIATVIGNVKKKP